MKKIYEKAMEMQELGTFQGELIAQRFALKHPFLARALAWSILTVTGACAVLIVYRVARWLM